MVHRLKHLAQIWLWQHGKVERQFAQLLLNHFEQQGNRLAARIRNGEAPVLVLDSFSPVVENQRLWERLNPHCERWMALSYLSAVEHYAASKSAEGFDLTPFAIDVPPEVQTGIRLAIKELRQQSYWVAIQSWSKQHIHEILERGVRDGASNREIAKAIQSAMGGQAAKGRAFTISRTETSNLLNSGHYMALEELGRVDPGAGATWLAIMDDRVRPEHAALHNTTIPIGSEFNLGGEKAPWPAHPSLSPQNRVHCRCTIVGAIPGF